MMPNPHNFTFLNTFLPHNIPAAGMLNNLERPPESHATKLKHNDSPISLSFLSESTLWHPVTSNDPLRPCLSKMSKITIMQPSATSDHCRLTTSKRSQSHPVSLVVYLIQHNPPLYPNRP